MTRRRTTFAITGVALMVGVAAFAHGTRTMTTPAPVAALRAVDRIAHESKEGVRATAKVQRLAGRTASSRADNSGWLDFAAPMDFSSGDRLLITIGGPASFVVLRLLPKNFDPTKPDMIVAEKLAVRSDRTVEATLTSDYKDITQVSAHGGPMPWGMFDLGAQNGHATIVRVDHVRP